jgi:hypothetical protein
MKSSAFAAEKSAQLSVLAHGPVMLRRIVSRIHTTWLRPVASDPAPAPASYQVIHIQPIGSRILGSDWVGVSAQIDIPCVGAVFSAELVLVRYEIELRSDGSAARHREDVVQKVVHRERRKPDGRWPPTVSTTKAVRDLVGAHEVLVITVRHGTLSTSRREIREWAGGAGGTSAWTTRQSTYGLGRGHAVATSIAQADVPPGRVELAAARRGPDLPAGHWTAPLACVAAASQGGQGALKLPVSRADPHPWRRWAEGAGSGAGAAAEPQTAGFIMPRTISCPECQGGGKVWKYLTWWTCEMCRGLGKVVVR